MESAALKAPRVPPSATPLIVELASMALLTVAHVVTPSALSAVTTWLVHAAAPPYAATLPEELVTRRADFTLSIQRLVVDAFVVEKVVLVEFVEVRVSITSIPVKWLLSPRSVEDAVAPAEIVLQPNLPPLKVNAFEALLQVKSPAPKKLVVLAVVAKKLVVVALEPVAFINVKF